MAITGEKRRGRRKSVNLMVHVQYGGDVTTGYINDLSASGIFVRASRFPPLYASVVVSFAPQDGDPSPVIVEGIVARVNRGSVGRRGARTPAGYGVWLASLPDAVRDRIGRFCGDGKAIGAKPPWIATSTRSQGCPQPLASRARGW